MKRLALLLIASRCLMAQTSPCDLNADGVVNVVDVQLAVNQSMPAVAACTNANLLNDGCTRADVNIVVNAALGLGCVAPHGGGTATDAVTIYEADGVDQSGRPISFGRAFVQGEFAQCLQPVVAGTPVTSYQVDVKNRWPADGSVKFASIGFVAPSLPANGSMAVTFQQATSCNNGGFLTQPQMIGFNSGNWGAHIEVTAQGVTRVADAKAMLTSLGFQDCQLNYWLQGPVVTQVIVQDCTSSSAYDFGWLWNGTTMSNPVTGNANTASLHPIFILSFYPSANTVQVEFILENMWTGRMQDQKYSFVLKTGNSLTQVYTSAGKAYADGSGIFTQLGGTRWHKTFWSGTAPGHIRIDHNFAYLTSTKLLPNYDQGVTVSPNSTSTLTNAAFPSAYAHLVGCPGNTGGDYSCFAAGDRGDIAGQALSPKGMNGGNDKGKLISREDLEYLYNMGTCGTVNGLCAEAWDVLTGEVDANPSNSLGGVSGGGGMWSMSGSWPIHQRESRTGLGSFYCPGYDTNNTTLSSTCGSGTGNTVGHGISRHTSPATGALAYGFIVSPVGTYTGNLVWSLEGNCDHWSEWAYTGYLLTGSYFEMEEIQQGANYCDFAGNPGNAWWAGNSFFTWFPFQGGSRNMSWSLQQNLYAATVTPDSMAAEQSYYNAVIRSNAAIMEGFYGITGTSQTPSSPNSSCTGYAPFAAAPSTATRWDFGHCGQGFGQFPTLHNPEHGVCNAADVYVNPQTVTAATNTNPSQLTMASSLYDGNSTVNIWGATGAWSVINSPGPSTGGSYGTASTLIDGTHVTISCQACASLSQPFTGTVQISTDVLDPKRETDFQEAWMDWAMGIVLNRALEMGFTSWTKVRDELNLRLLESVEDEQFNPWLISLYKTPTLNGVGACQQSSTTNNPYLSTWAEVKAAVIPQWQTQATFDTNQSCSTDHAYQVTARALGSFLPGITDTCSQGACTGSAAWTWLQQHVPYYNASVADSASCASGNDIQVPLALAPRP
jgi:hypothetical protein